jgi:hypothetical protein
MDTSYRTPTNRTTTSLLEAHCRVLVEGSGIAPEIIVERGVRTVRSGRDLPPEYSWRQQKRVPGILFTAHRPNGTTTTIFRPDEPDPDNPGAKYLQPPKKKPRMKRGGPGNVLDVLEGHRIGEMDTPVLFTEGFKKADSITSAGRREDIEILAVAISGVWNFLSEGEPIADMYHIPVEGRRVYVAFDSDMLRNPMIQMAAERLAEHLEGRGAEVLVIYLEDQPDGSKTGADDFLVAGGTLKALLALARHFDPEDLQRERLSRDEKLWRALAWLMRRDEEMPAKSCRDCSKLATWRAVLTFAEKRGKLVKDGVEVFVPAMTGAELAAMSQPTFSKCLHDLVEDGYLRRIKRERSEQADSYVLRVPGGVVSFNDGEREPGKGPESREESGDPRGYNVIPPLPEMRWSSPGRKGRRGVVEGTRRVRQGRSLSEDEPSVRRPGKKRREIVAYLVENGGSATRKELLEQFGGPKTQWRDFKKQTLVDLLGRRRRYRGEELSVGPPIIELTDAGVQLVEDWREALDEHRELGGEEDAAIRQKVDHLRQRAAYHQRNDTPPDRAPSEEEMAEGREERQKRRKAARLVYEGVAKHIVAEDVLGADGFIEELQPAKLDPDLSPGPDPPPREPELEGHPLACECINCAARMPRYARSFGGARP